MSQFTWKMRSPTCKYGDVIFLSYPNRRLWHLFIDAVIRSRIAKSEHPALVICNIGCLACVKDECLAVSFLNGATKYGKIAFIGKLFSLQRGD